MIYVALLRGINVGGNNKVDMKVLKATFEAVGMKSVTTYINSGNVIFTNESPTPNKLIEKIEDIIEQAFGFKIKVLLRDLHTIQATVEALPSAWKNDDSYKCDVMFLWEAIDHPEVVRQLTIKPGIDDVRYTPGAILWRVNRENVTRSGIMKLVGTKVYKNMTIRNCNTARKLLERMDQITLG